MDTFCVECGAHLAGGHFCPDCGTQIPDDAPGAAAADPHQQGASPDSDAAPPPRRSGKLVAGIVAATVALLAIGAVGAYAMTHATSAAEQQAVQAQRQAEEAQRIAEAEAQRLRLRRQMERIAAKKVQEHEAAQADTPPPPAEPEVAYPVAGWWTGEMAGGDYTVTMHLSESEDGGVWGTIDQQDTRSGESGTEYVSGGREGNRLELQGYRWADAPGDWEYDTITVTVLDGGNTLDGSYWCESGGTRAFYATVAYED